MLVQMKSTLSALLILLSIWTVVCALQPIPKAVKPTECQLARMNMALHFRTDRGEAQGGDGGFIGSLWKGIQRFLPGTSKARLAETYSSSQSDPGHRYHVRLTNASPRNKRHIITRLRRYLPDLTWQTAEHMVDRAIENGASLVRVLTSKNEAAYLVDMLKKADPPVNVEVYDSKMDEVIVL